VGTTNTGRTYSAFTIVELMLIIATVAILAGIGILGYNGWQKRSIDSAVRSDLAQAASGLKSHQNFNGDYPPNLAGINFAASDKVGLILRTNAPQIRTYDNMTPSQNAQLFLNTCNANMPIMSADGLTTYNTACTFAGNNIHISGQVSSNVVLQGPTIDINEVALTCGSTCDAAVSAMKSQFMAQNGTFPLDVPKNQVALPPPTLTTYSTATKYCLEGRGVTYADIVYHITSANTAVTPGACPSDPELHYP